MKQVGWLGVLVLVGSLPKSCQTPWLSKVAKMGMSPVLALRSVQIMAGMVGWWANSRRAA